jgi:tetratricopeptide (TPR) repeat protein
MIDVDDAAAAVQKALLAGDADAVDAARAAYLELESRGPVAADMRYRLGLSRLFRHKDPDGAIEFFKDAAAEKGAPVANEARVSLALCLSSRGKRQNAIFELKKMLPEGAPPTPHTANALDFLSLLLRESKAPHKDIIAVDEQRKHHLKSLADSSADIGDKAHYLMRFAAAFADGGGVELATAKKIYDDVIKLGPKAGTAVAAARAAQAALPKR